MPHSLKDLCKFRYEQGQAALESSRILLNQNDIRGSLNRSYYAIFYAARALLALDQLESRKHSGVVAIFIKEYIATGKFGKELSNIIKGAQKIRIESDYEDFYLLPREAAELQVESAEKFVKEIKQYLENKLGFFSD